MVTACTIIARNYRPYARVLADSFLAHHPSGSFTILEIDADASETAAPGDGITWCRLHDLGLDPPEIRRLAAMYDVTELATAVKPLLLQRLLDQGCRETLYLDPDICIYAPLDHAAALTHQHGILLTPHTMQPFPADHRAVDRDFILAAGVYNLGFIGVSAAARPFLAWWWQYTRREALIDLPNLRFTDQRIVDFVPALFDHHLLKDPGYNVAYWNLHGREVQADSTGDLIVDGVPLRFFHFSGFDVGRPWLLSRNQGDRPRILLSEQPAVRRLCQDYARRVGQAAAGNADAVPYRWGTLPSGSVITTRMRRIYWKALRAAERSGAAEPPDPFDPAQPHAFVAWLNAPDPRGPRALSRYHYSIYLDRVDLQVHFRDIDGADAPRFVDWLWTVGIAPEPYPAELRPAANPAIAAAAVPPVPSRGVNIAGYFRAELGVGEAARLLTLAMEAASIPHSTTTCTTTLSRQEHGFAERAQGEAAHDVVILCVNADSTPQFVHDAGPAFFAGRHTIGYWFWEVEDFPASMHAAFAMVDEIWTATEFVAATIRKVSPKPVFTVPLPLPSPTWSPALTRAHLKLPDRFTFLLVFDFLSVFDRKNPLGVIEAFTRAFLPDEGPILVLKSINGYLRLNDLERLRAAAEPRPDVLLVEDYFSVDEKNALLGGCDCYVSLHRSEGLGLTLAEAMALGKPAIATAYSGNLHFMTAENSYLVPAATTPIPPGCEPYPTSSVWADPDLDQAARVMREVYDRPAEAVVRARRGQSDVLTKHGSRVSAAAVSARLQAIWRDRASRITVPVVAVPQEVTMSLDAPPPPGMPVSEPLEALMPQLETLAAPRASAGLRGTAQRLLFRVLRPYWFQQYQLHRFVIAAFGRVAAAMRYEQQRREALDTQVRELTRELVECRRELKRLEGAVGDRDDSTAAAAREPSA